jgi:hypothetical protein
VPEPIAADALTRRIDAFLSSRGLSAPSAPVASGASSALASSAPTSSAPVSNAPDVASAPGAAAPTPADFVSEAEVRSAMKRGEKILVGEKTIITPAARDTGEANKVFVYISLTNYK